jgi:hypothetical protein
VFDVMPTRKKTPKLPVTRTAGRSSERAWLDAYLMIANAEPELLERTESRADLERAFRYQLELDHAHGVLRAVGRLAEDVDGRTWSKVALEWHRSAPLPFDTPPVAWLRSLRSTAELIGRQREVFRRQLAEAVAVLRTGSAVALRRHRAQADVNLEAVRVEVAGVDIDTDFELHYRFRYYPKNDAGMHGLLWTFLIAKNRGFGATLRCCALEERRDTEANVLARKACGRFYFAEPVAGGGRLSNFCSDKCRTTNEREKHAALMRRSRRGP